MVMVVAGNLLHDQVFMLYFKLILCDQFLIPSEENRFLYVQNLIKTLKEEKCSRCTERQIMGINFSNAEEIKIQCKIFL
jgi:hypothetical protein